jgi:polygalacturonase
MCARLLPDGRGSVGGTATVREQAETLANLWQGQSTRMPLRVLLFTALGAGAFAQDTRVVHEPSIPPSCATLTAQSGAFDENRPDTIRIQEALDRCGAGHAVELKAGPDGHTFLAGPLALRQGVTLLVDSGVVLLGSRNPRDYDFMPGSCGIVNQAGHGCKPLIGADHVAGAGVMGDGVIDGRGGSKLIGQQVSWWDLAQEAKVKNLNQSCPRIMQLNSADDFTLYRITLKNSPNFHVSYSGGNGFTAWGVFIESPKTARNTDGIDPSSATNVTITNSFIRVGDDNVAIKAGSRPSTHMTISHNHFYSGHGMSIGSETDGGASAIRVMDLSIEGADNGIRIKSNSSRGGLVRDVVYSDVCIRDTKNPILMDTHYSFRGTATNKLPDFREITFENVRIMGPGEITLDGLDATHPLGLIFNGLALDPSAGIKVVAHHADIKVGPAGSDLRPSGTGVSVTSKAADTTRNTCEGKFVPFPARNL